MAFNKIDRDQYEKQVGDFVERRRPPKEIRYQVDLGFRIRGSSVELFEIRPLWSDPERNIEEPVAKATYSPKTGTWKVYWQQSDLKWHRYRHAPEAASLDEFLDIVEKDEHDCFWG